ncbi:MAG: bifunctional 3-deoxy-7-phosphoheptulonate synthase/chorismate mutase type II [Vicingaceae bacterium]
MKKFQLNDTLKQYKSEGRLFIIAGPCSVENAYQVKSTVSFLKNTGKVSLIRGGIWKPRTRPNQFEGIGEEGLKWLKEAGKEANLPVATEVATAKHVEACLNNAIDVLWIGARTTVNPFSVSEIAEALRGVDLPVMVKNPINPDLKLWIGAIERLQTVGVKDVTAVHRGFSSFDKTAYRNAPMWELPIELKRQTPQLPVICDPSHISGDVELLPKVAQKALDLDMDGLMIEAHYDPSMALSDAHQQLNEWAFNNLLDNLKTRQHNVDNASFVNQLNQLRHIIDELDEDIINKLASRMKIAQQIGAFKKQNNVTAFQLERWNEIFETRTMLADKAGLSKEFIAQLLNAIHKESIQIQTKIMNNKNGGAE